MNDDYLFHKSGTPDPEVERLEKLLAPYRFEPNARPLILPNDASTDSDRPTRHEAQSSVESARAPMHRPSMMLPTEEESRSGGQRPNHRSDARHFATAGAVAYLLAAAAIIALAIGILNRDSRNLGTGGLPANGGYRLIGVTGRDRVQAGEEIVTGEDAVATLEIGGLGRVELQPKTRLLVEPAKPDEHRFYLEHGSVHARILAEARRFQIATPAGRSIDLGCEYSLDVGDDGVSRLHVLTGQVAFEFDGREVYVPAGATCVSELRRGPGAPVFDDASDEFKRALLEVEWNSSPAADALARMLDCDQEEALAVWHLFDSDRGSVELRNKCYERLSRIFAKPQGVTEAGLIGGDRAMRNAWLETMKPWWRR